MVKLVIGLNYDDLSDLLTSYSYWGNYLKVWGSYLRVRDNS